MCQPSRLPFYVFVFVCQLKKKMNLAINYPQTRMLAGIWAYLKFAVFEEARAQMGGKKEERRKVRWGRVFAWAGTGVGQTCQSHWGRSPIQSWKCICPLLF